MIGKVLQHSLFPELEQEFMERMRKMNSVSIISSDLTDLKRKKTRFENQHLLHDIPREGVLGMPKASPVYFDRTPSLFVPYNCIKSYRTTHACVHFYIDDYHFSTVWKNLEQTLRNLAKYDAVISTDDSVFLDVPLIDNLCNVYKNRVFTAVGQRMGLKVVPSFSCGNPKDIAFYCDGLPEGGCIAVGGMGTNITRSKRAIFKYCVTEMCKRKHPNLLLVYGNNVDLGLDIPVVKIPTFVEYLRKKVDNG